uniref:EGF-like domain-containing protein n=1 Tax=Clastoptera arizonana TaxID=38151 RepID=A0A1B6DD56_9HEMI
MIHYVNRLFFVLFLCVIINSSLSENKNCTIDSISQCNENETCVQIKSDSKTGICNCKRGFKDFGQGCIPYTPSTVTPGDSLTIIPAEVDLQSGGIFTIWFIIPLGALFMVGLCIFVSKRYMLMDRVYQMRIRRYNNVLVTSQGDEDDPPIA